jgi:hypothetical protein
MCIYNSALGDDWRLLRWSVIVEPSFMCLGRVS